MIIKLDVSHAQAIKNIEDSCFSHPLSLENIVNSLQNDKYINFGYLEGEEVVGYISVFTVADEAYINNVAVLETYRNKNIATKLIKEVLDFVNKGNYSFITLEVRISNFPAISLYEKNGFDKVATRKKYYNQPIEDAIIMTKTLGESK